MGSPNQSPDKSSKPDANNNSGAKPELQSPTGSNPPSPTVFVEYAQQKAKAGLLVTKELDIAIERVKKNVADIVRQCRARNSKFRCGLWALISFVTLIPPVAPPLCRDIEFDLEEDRECCLYGLNTPLDSRPDPSDVRRVTQIFKKPRFFHEGPNWTDVIQGDIGNCWFLSGVTAVATMPGLVEKFCVARDEEVGVYGFTFQRDGIWTDVIVSSPLAFIPAFH